MDTRHRLGIRLKHIRKQRGFTQDQLAGQTGRSVDAISNLERGKSLPSFETIERLSQALGVELKTLFDFEEERQSPRRLALIERVRAIAGELPTADLQLAVDQLEALQRRGRVK
ncbi:helix-turn-helix transcriptional regulator [Mesorhizobium salmacidum]|uniref:Helix-turn-helix transcriptional regulator n=1 Tax=Mesorhizobium salmacidum TaxID=3015171 RepID=A0ABU8KUP4_9HYPH